MKHNFAATSHWLLGYSSSSICFSLVCLMMVIGEIKLFGRNSQKKSDLLDSFLLTRRYHTIEKFPNTQCLIQHIEFHERCNRKGIVYKIPYWILSKITWIGLYYIFRIPFFAFDTFGWLRHQMYLASTVMYTCSVQTCKIRRNSVSRGTPRIATINKYWIGFHLIYANEVNMKTTA